jgi:arylsulfatase A-like enzyme
VIDGLRSDKCHSVTKTAITPNLDSLRKKGVYFKQTISSAAATGIAISSILTGQFPFKTGMGGRAFHKLDKSIPSYIGFLKANGYHTFSTAPKVATDFGLIFDFEKTDSGFENYLSLFSGLGKQIIDKFTSGYLKEPWFFYIHFNDLHFPITVQKEFDDEKYGTSNYEKQLSSIDVWIGKILEQIDLENTLVILTSDHGEYVPVITTKDGFLNFESSSTEANLWKLGNKIPSGLYPMKKKLGSLLRKTRKKTKKSKINNLSLTPYQNRILFDSRMGSGHRCFDDLIKVPLIFTGFGIPKNMTISQQVRHVDIFPTITEIISLKYDHDTDGKSLFSLINGKKLNELPASIESPPTVKGVLTKSIGVRTSNFKYIRDIDNSKKIFELYDLKKDPLEENNIINRQPQIAKEMESILMKIRQNITNIEEDIDDEKSKIVRDNLRKLGYI